MNHYLDCTSKPFFSLFVSLLVSYASILSRHFVCSVFEQVYFVYIYISNMYLHTSSIIYILLVLLPIAVRSLLFFNIWHSCVDVSVEENRFPISLIQSNAYYQVCPASQEHWRRFGSSEFRMHILRTSEPFVDKIIYLNHNGYVHFHNESRLTLAKSFGATHEDL